MFEGWLGKGKVLSAQRVLRPKSNIEEQVQCSVLYNNSSIVNFYHGFHQASRMDRQEMKLVFERGEITLHEWVPASVDIYCIASEAETRTLMDIFPNSRLNVVDYFAPQNKMIRARHKSFEAYQKIKIYHENPYGKMEVYSHALRDFFRDNLEWIKDKNFQRKIIMENGYRSLQMAVEANAAMVTGV